MEIPKRKTVRLQNFNYSNEALYFITICAADRKQIFSKIKAVDVSDIETSYVITPTPCGIIVSDQLKLLEERYPNVTIEDLAIMPDHIHAIIYLHENNPAHDRRISLSDIICTFKSITTRICKRELKLEKVFQRSYYDHIIRDHEDYEAVKLYIAENPKNWYLKYNIGLA